MLGKKLYLNVSDLVENCHSLLECSSLVDLLAGDRFTIAHEPKLIENLEGGLLALRPIRVGNSRNFSYISNKILCW